jgi:hypothetical protein
MLSARAGALGFGYVKAVNDTTPLAQERYFELLRAQTPAERLRTAVLLTEAVRSLIEASIKSEDPNATPTQVRARLTARLYGREVAERLFPGEG